MHIKDGVKMNERLNKALGFLPSELNDIIGNMPIERQNEIQEIRLRVNNFPTVTVYGKNYTISGTKKLEKETIEEVFERVCDYSIHSHEVEINSGFITVQGGHRIGFCGTKTENTIKYISSINIRIASEIIGCGSDIAKLFKASNKGILVAGPPLSGKTTVLRDTARIIGNINKVSIVDERNEISATFNGVPQNNVGKFTDVLNGYTKTKGIEIATRVLSPDVIVFDEIGSKGEAKQVSNSFGTGVRFIASVHSDNPTDLLTRHFMKSLIKKGVFGFIVFLDTNESVGKIKQIVNTEDLIYENRSNNTTGSNLRIFSR